MRDFAPETPDKKDYGNIPRAQNAIKNNNLDYMYKKSNLLTAAVAHIGQNSYTKSKVLRPRKEYLSAFLEGVTGKAYRTKGQAFRDGVEAGTLSPEYGELTKRFRRLGEAAKTNPSTQSMTKRD